MSLNEWFGEREVLLTGVTSEVGRAVLEKILRTFPKIKVYSVLRSRSGYNKDDRIKRIFLSPGYKLFDNLNRLKIIFLHLNFLKNIYIYIVLIKLKLLNYTDYTD